ncbi:MAG: hypothetical protein V7L05_20440 [Nostoc sp.]|uniref:hypothetical protein n=1 Tax=Nostoc sp. TaxID=1180 RepID=UPI002FF8C9B6
MTHYYKLEEHTPVAVDFDEWVTWRTFANTQVILSVVYDSVSISTVFLGINLGSSERPMLFESLVTGGSLNGKKRLYTDWDDAVTGHYNLVIESIAKTPV